MERDDGVTVNVAEQQKNWDLNNEKNKTKSGSHLQYGADNGRP